MGEAARILEAFIEAAQRAPLAEWQDFSGIVSTTNVDTQYETLERGCFGIIEPSDIFLLLDHDPKKPVGMWTEFTQNDDKLIGKGSIWKPGPHAAAALRLIEFGAGLSVGFKKLDTFIDSAGIEHVRKASLKEISLVISPGNRASRVIVEDDGGKKLLIANDTLCRAAAAQRRSFGGW